MEFIYIIVMLTASGGYYFLYQYLVIRGLRSVLNFVEVEYQ